MVGSGGPGAAGERELQSVTPPPTAHNNVRWATSVDPQGNSSSPWWRERLPLTGVGLDPRGKTP